MRFIRRLRWWELAPEAVLGVVLAVFAVTETSAALSAFKSPKAIVLMLGVGVVWIAGRLLLPLVVRHPAPRVVVFFLAAFALAKIVVFPAYDDHTVVETLAARSTPTTAATATPAPSSVPTDMVPATIPPTSAPPTTAAADPVVVATGSFAGIDHRASGTVRVYRAADGSFVVGLEDFDIQPGPDYDVYVVSGADREHRDGAVRLDDLRGNRGTQYYDVPDGVGLDQGAWTVLVWCETFGVPVANATPVA